MSKIINGIREVGKTFNDSGMLYPMMALFALPSLVFSTKDGLYMWVLAAYILAVGFAVIQWDRGQYKESNGCLIGMAVFLVFIYSLIGNDNKWVPVVALLNMALFLMQLCLWAYSWSYEARTEFRRINEAVK